VLNACRIHRAFGLELAQQVQIHLDILRALRVEVCRCAGALLLLVERGLEPGHIHRHTDLARHVLRQVEREAVRVVQPECLCTGDDVLTARLDLRDEFLQQCNAVGERGREARLFLLDIGEDEVATAGQFGIVRPHRLDDGPRNICEERPVEPQHPAVPRGPAQNQTQHVATALVRRHHAVANEERDRAAVIRDDAIGDRALRVLEILHHVAAGVDLRQ